jgi:hypothetical protein
MAEFDLLVLNGIVVTDQETRELDIAVKDGKIAKLCPRGSLIGVEAKKSIDAQGGMLMVRGFLYSSGRLKLTLLIARWCRCTCVTYVPLYLIPKKR